MKYPIIKPYQTEELFEDLRSTILSGHWTEGSVTKQFEESCKNYINCSYANAVVNCTVGLDIALRLFQIGPEDEVIVPDYTYPATASVVRNLGAKVVLVDIDRETMNISYDQLKKAITSKTKVIMPVSLFGNPLDYKKLNSIKEKYSIYIVEDAACSFGAEFEDHKVGYWSDISVFSFHPRKFISTGEGGLITTNNQVWADWINSYKHFGLDMNLTNKPEFSMMGTNSKLSDVLSTIGLFQLKYIDMLLLKRRESAHNYIALLSDCPDVILPKVTNAGKHSYQSFCIYVENRDQIINEMKNNGIEVQIGTFALSQQMVFKNDPLCYQSINLENSLYAYEHALTLPLYHDMTTQDQEIIISCLMKCFD